MPAFFERESVTPCVQFSAQHLTDCGDAPDTYTRSPSLLLFVVLMGPHACWCAPHRGTNPTEGKHSALLFEERSPRSPSFSRASLGLRLFSALVYSLVRAEKKESVLCFRACCATLLSRILRQTRDRCVSLIFTPYPSSRHTQSIPGESLVIRSAEASDREQRELHTGPIRATTINNKTTKLEVKSSQVKSSQAKPRAQQQTQPQPPYSTIP
jgi:hypothetical protein